MNNRTYADEGIFDGELAFYHAFKANEHQPVAIREAACLKEMFKYCFLPLQRGDLLAGRIRYLLTGMSSENTAGGILIYCKNRQILRELAASDVSPAYRRKVEEMVEYMVGRRLLDSEASPMLQGQLPEALSEELLRATNNSVSDMSGRLAGTVFDYDKLIRLGLPGLVEEVKHYRDANAKKEPFVKLGGGSENSARIYEGMLSMLEAMRSVCLSYAAEARETAASLSAGDPVADADDAKWKAELLELAECLENIADRKPATLREGLQLAWLYALGASSVNFGRMDVYAGDLYVNDLAEGRLTEERALAFVQAFWQLTVIRRIAARETAEFNARIVIGGKGRRNPENADRFALLAMEATRTVVETEPQLTLRVYEGMNEALMRKALDVIGEGRIYPMLYNDDVNIPGVAEAFDVSEESATLYYPYGCGEYVLEHTSVGSPNCSFNTLKTLEITLHNGVDPKSGLQVGLKTGTLDSFTTFEKLWDAYAAQVEYFVIALGKRHVIEYDVEAKQMCFLLTSILYDDCLKKGLGMCDGGPRYRGSIIESFGLVNTGDSLNVINQLVYEKKRMTLERLVEILDSNFAGAEREYKMLQMIPKYGNDDDQADMMVRRTTDHLADFCRTHAKEIGLDYFLIVNINNWYNVELAKNTGASADGRLDAAPFANGNTPTAGYDRSGVTAMMNSLTKIRSDNHAGYSHNMKFNKAQFRSDKDKIHALLRGYWRKGGTQAMITAVSRGDLEDAMKHPEKYMNLIVRVGGFSARFIELRRDIQQDLVNRTLHEV